jgi:hypothetical protein
MGKSKQKKKGLKMDTEITNGNFLLYMLGFSLMIAICLSFFMVRKVRKIESEATPAAIRCQNPYCGRMIYHIKDFPFCDEGCEQVLMDIKRSLAAKKAEKFIK